MILIAPDQRPSSLVGSVQTNAIKYLAHNSRVRIVSVRASVSERPSRAIVDFLFLLFLFLSCPLLPPRARQQHPSKLRHKTRSTYAFHSRTTSNRYKLLPHGSRTLSFSSCFSVPFVYLHPLYSHPPPAPPRLPLLQDLDLADK